MKEGTKNCSTHSTGSRNEKIRMCDSAAASLSNNSHQIANRGGVASATSHREKTFLASITTTTASTAAINNRGGNSSKAHHHHGHSVASNASRRRESGDDVADKKEDGVSLLNTVDTHEGPVSTAGQAVNGEGNTNASASAAAAAASSAAAAAQSNAAWRARSGGFSTLPYRREAAFLSSILPHATANTPTAATAAAATSGALVRKTSAGTGRRSDASCLPATHSSSPSASPTSEKEAGSGEFPTSAANYEATTDAISDVTEIISAEGQCARMVMYSKNSPWPMCMSTVIALFGETARRAAAAAETEDLVNNNADGDFINAAEEDTTKGTDLQGKARHALRSLGMKHSEKTEPDEYFTKHVNEDFAKRQQDALFSDPYFLDNPGISGERRRKLMLLPSYRCSIISYVDKKVTKKDIDQQFFLRHPQLEPKQIKLTYIRKLKTLLFQMAWDEASPLEMSTMAAAIWYFERLVNRLYVTKVNRKLVLCGCVLLAIKFLEIGMPSKRKMSYAFDRMHELFGISRSRVLAVEFKVYSALEFTLLVPMDVLSTHMERLLLLMNLTPAEYLNKSFQQTQNRQ